MTRPKGVSDLQPRSDNGAPLGVTTDPGDGPIDEADTTTSDAANATVTGGGQVVAAEPATVTDGNETTTDLADEPANDEAVEAAVTMVDLQNERKAAKTEPAVRVTRSSARAAAERTAAQ